MTRTWIGIQGGKCYTAFASRLNLGGENPCPCCRKPITKVQEGARDSAGDLITWESYHPCGARLMIFAQS
jgi:hypothetical protein